MYSNIAGARRAREVIFSVLRDSCLDGDLTIPEAVEAAKDLFAQNAIVFYNIKLSSKLDLTKALSLNFGVTANIVPQSNITFVRVIWVDTSGQCRCRVSL